MRKINLLLSSVVFVSFLSNAESNTKFDTSHTRHLAQVEGKRLEVAGEVFDFAKVIAKAYREGYKAAEHDIIEGIKSAIASSKSLTSQTKDILADMLEEAQETYRRWDMKKDRKVERRLNTLKTKVSEELISKSEQEELNLAEKEAENMVTSAETSSMDTQMKATPMLTST